MNRAEQRERTAALVSDLHEIGKMGAGRLRAILLKGSVMGADGRERDLNALELNAITGTAIDKIAKYENWEKKGVGEAGDWVRALVSGLQQAGGGRIALEVEAQPIPVETKVIEATVIEGIVAPTQAVSYRANASPERLAQLRENERLRQQKARDKKRAMRELAGGA